MLHMDGTHHSCFLRKQQVVMDKNQTYCVLAGMYRLETKACVSTYKQRLGSDIMDCRQTELCGI